MQPPLLRLLQQCDSSAPSLRLPAESGSSCCFAGGHHSNKFRGDIRGNVQGPDQASADGVKKEQDRDASKDKEKETHRDNEREREKEKPRRVYKTDEGLLVACRYFDRTGSAIRLRHLCCAAEREDSKQRSGPPFGNCHCSRAAVDCMRFTSHER